MIPFTILGNDRHTFAICKRHFRTTGLHKTVLFAWPLAHVQITIYAHFAYRCCTRYFVICHDKCEYYGTQKRDRYAYAQFFLRHAETLLITVVIISANLRYQTCNESRKNCNLPLLALHLRSFPPDPYVQCWQSPWKHGLWNNYSGTVSAHGL